MSEPRAITLYGDDGAPTVTIVAPTNAAVMGLFDDYIRHISMLGALNEMVDDLVGLDTGEESK